jgi:ribosomal protein S6--L-glutamate ligase
MKIAILSRNRNLYSTRRLAEAAEKRGHTVRIVDVLRCYMNIAPRSPEIHYRGQKLERYDAVIPRIGASVTYYGAAVVRQFEMMGTYCVNESVAITRARDKLRALQLLARRGIGLPITAFAHSPDDTHDMIQLVRGAPMVLKLIEGTQGKGVVLAETDQAAASVIDAFRDLNAHFLVQEFIQEARGTDIRCFVVGGKVVAAMERKAPPGGTARAVKLTREERATATRAARVLGLNVAGVDIVRSRNGPAVLEVNSSPGLEGIEAATGEDIAGRIIGFIEAHARPNHTRTKGKG